MSVPLKNAFVSFQSQFHIRYDATAAGLVAAMKLHVAVDMSQELQTITYVVVMTDGEDNDSEVSLEALCGLVAQVNRMRNFKVLAPCVVCVIFVILHSQKCMQRVTCMQTHIMSHDTWTHSHTLSDTLARTNCHSHLHAWLRRCCLQASTCRTRASARCCG